jgi:hypothetical protein
MRAVLQSNPNLLSVYPPLTLSRYLFVTVWPLQAAS